MYKKIALETLMGLATTVTEENLRIALKFVDDQVKEDSSEEQRLKYDFLSIKQDGDGFSFEIVAPHSNKLKWRFTVTGGRIFWKYETKLVGNYG